MIFTRLVTPKMQPKSRSLRSDGCSSARASISGCYTQECREFTKGTPGFQEGEPPSQRSEQCERKSAPEECAIMIVTGIIEERYRPLERVHELVAIEVHSAAERGRNRFRQVVAPPKCAAESPAISRSRGG